MNTTLTINNLHASVEGKDILHGVDIRITSGDVHAVMGPNGSGKSTLASVLMGHPHYDVVRKKKKEQGSITLGRKNILALSTEDRARAGLFLAFQSPTAVAGVTVMNLLRESYQAIHGKSSRPEATKYNPAIVKMQNLGDMTISEFSKHIHTLAQKLALNPELLRRGIHDGFSGGEKKKIEMLQALVLKPGFAVFDEIDTGLDVDALKAVAYGIGELKKNGTGVLIITHYQRILRFIKPDYVHILFGGRIVRTGDAALAKKIEKTGYGEYR